MNRSSKDGVGTVATANLYTNNLQRLKKINNNDKVIKARKAVQRKTIFTMAILLLIVFSVTYMYVQVSSLDREIALQESDILELNKTLNSLNGEMEGIKNSIDIADTAKYKLGMVYPEDNQIIYIDVEQPQKKDKVEDNVFLSPVISILKFFNK